MINPNEATLEQQLSALFNYLENRCAMENAERVRPFPTDSQGNTADAIETAVAVTFSSDNGEGSFKLNTPSDSLQIALVPREMQNVVVRGQISRAMAELLVANPNLAIAVSGKIYNDCRAAIIEKKPIISDAEALLAGTAVMTFKHPGTGKFLIELDSGDFEYRCFSDCIAYPKAFLK